MNETGERRRAAGVSEPGGIARQVTLPGDGPTGVFLSEDGGTCPW